MECLSLNTQHGTNSARGQFHHLGRASFSQFLNAAGVFMVDGVKKSISGDAWTPNSPVTIALKGSSKPLIDTGVMLNSVTFAIHDYGRSQ